MSGKYDDIIKLPHPTSKNHPRMPVKDRAAQFAAFAALTGYGEAVKETERLTEKRRELDENRKAELDAKLRYIDENIPLSPRVSISYFVPDGRKSGGSYVRAEGQVKKIDSCTGLVILSDGREIRIEDIDEIEIGE